jgi:hypothetical protein
MLMQNIGLRRHVTPLVQLRCKQQKRQAWWKLRVKAATYTFSASCDH